MKAAILPRGIEPATEGSALLGKYRLLRRLGSGAAGSVWAALHLGLGHSVAVKLLDPRLSSCPDWRRRFEREARLSASLGEESIHVTRVTDYGVLPDETPFLVMELLRGRSLAERLREECTLEPALVVRIVSHLCRALEVTHARGVVHRDLKPANVFLHEPAGEAEPIVKLLDFGVAKAPAESDATHATLAGTVIGTPPYMSPEQILADPETDFRADLWAVAGMAYRMCVGELPFGAGDVGAVGARILYGNPRPPSSIRPELPVEFDRWIAKGLARHPDDRFQSAREMAESLEPILAGRRLGRRSALRRARSALFRSAEPATVVIPPAASTVVPSSTPPASRRDRWALACMGVLVAGAFIVGLSSRTGIQG
jgi:serine/threonine-protein kinase